MKRRQQRKLSINPEKKENPRKLKGALGPTLASGTQTQANVESLLYFKPPPLISLTGKGQRILKVQGLSK